MGKVIKPEEFGGAASTASQARAALDAYVREGGSLVDIARELELAPGRLERLCTGKEQDGTAELASRVMEFLGVATRQPGSEFVMTRTASEILAVVGYTVGLRGMSIVWGDPGVGKTMALRRYCEEHPGQAVWVKGTLHHDRPMAFLDDLIAACGLPALGNQERPRVRYRHVVDALSGELREKVVFVDEAQHLSLATMEMLRSVHDDTGVPIVMAGNERVYDRMYGGGQAGWAQLFSRLTIQCRVRNNVGADDIRALVGADLDTASIRFLQGLARKGGSLRAVGNCVRLGRIMAAGCGGRVDLKVLKKALEILAPGRDGATGEAEAGLDETPTSPTKGERSDGE